MTVKLKSGKRWVIVAINGYEVSTFVGTYGYLPKIYVGISAAFLTDYVNS